MASAAEIAAFRAALPEFTSSEVADPVVGGWLDEAAQLYTLSAQGAQLCAAHLYVLDKAERPNGVAPLDGGGDGLIEHERLGGHSVTYIRDKDERRQFFERTTYGRRLMQLERVEIGVRLRVI